MMYYFVSTFILTVAVAYVFFLLVEGPILSLSGIYEEGREIREGNKTFKFKFLEITKNLFPDDD
jgi:hypothetical protein